MGITQNIDHVLKLSDITKIDYFEFLELRESKGLKQKFKKKIFFNFLKAE